jgi:hypothetical protein
MLILWYALLYGKERDNGGGRSIVFAKIVKQSR